jgi:O-antigen ligase/tetratricopeptide (TPR) repeat protein
MYTIPTHMSTSRLRTIIIWLIFIAVCGTPLFYFAQGVYPYTLSKQVFFQGIIEVAFALWLVLALRERAYRPRWTPLAVTLAVFLGILLLTSFTGVDAARSLWSTYERGIGVVALLHFAALTLMCSTLSGEMPWRKFWYASLSVAGLTSALAWLQLSVPNLLLVEDVGGRPGSTFGNPTFLAGYLLLNFFIGLYFLLEYFLAAPDEHGARQPSPWRRGGVYALLGLLALIGYGIFIGQTRGDLIALGVGLFLLALLFVFVPPRLKGFLGKRAIYAAVTLCIVVLAAAFLLTKENRFWQSVPGLNRLTTVSLSSPDLLPRTYAWGAAIEGIKERPLLGWGWDNFNIVYSKYYDPRALESGYTETRFDKPHNFLLEYPIDGGIPLALAYVAVFVALLYEAVKTKKHFWWQCTAVIIVAYGVRNSVVFETIGPFVMLYAFMGFMDGQYRRSTDTPLVTTDPRQNHKRRAAPPSGVSVAIAAVAGLVLAYGLNIRVLQASYYQFEAFQGFGDKNPAAAIDYFHRAIDVASPYSWNFKRDYAAAVIDAYFYNQDTISAEEVKTAVHAMEEAKDEHSADAFNHILLADLYNQASSADPSFIVKAEQEERIALAQSPQRQEAYFSLAKTKTLQKDIPAALDALRKALALDPKIPDAHFYYGLILFESGDQANGLAEVQQSLSLGRVWKNYYEPLTVGNYFADTGNAADLQMALHFYKVANSMEPGDTETEIKLGVAYFFTGDKSNAYKYLSDVGKRFDYRTSPSYTSLKPILDELGITPSAPRP